MDPALLRGRASDLGSFAPQTFCLHDDFSSICVIKSYPWVLVMRYGRVQGTLEASPDQLHKLRSI